MLIATVCCLIVIGLAKYFWPEMIPFDFLGFWTIDHAFEGILRGWPLYVWGIALTSFLKAIRGISTETSPGEIILYGGTMSIWAGVREETFFRWLLFYALIVGIPFFDWLLLGFMGWNWIEWLNVEIFIPVTNFVTLGYLEHYLRGYSWAVGAAIVAASQKFRDGHKYQGFIGWVNSWFLGMWFFWTMFTFGLPSAVVVHTVYNFGCYLTVAAIVAIKERA